MALKKMLIVVSLVCFTTIMQPSNVWALLFRLPLSIDNCNQSGNKCYITAYYDLGGSNDWNCGKVTYGGHRGTDIGINGWGAMDEGRKVYAAASGIVNYTVDGNPDHCTSGSCGGGGGYGNYVKIEHSPNFFSIYGHLKTGSVAVKTGDQITCGDYLGEVGSAGNSTGPHLHFEIRPNAGGYNDADDPFSSNCGLGGPISYWVQQNQYLSLPEELCDPDDPGYIPPKPEPDAGSVIPVEDDTTDNTVVTDGNNAKLVTESFPQGISVSSNQIFTKSWTFENNGSLAWLPDSGYKLKLIEGQQLGNVTDIIMNIVPSSSGIEVGQNYIYEERFVAPSTQGVYETKWQNSQDGVGNFGEIVILKVIVEPKEYSATLLESLDVLDGTAVLPTSIFQKTWVLKNSGRFSWSTGKKYSFQYVSGESFGIVSPQDIPSGEIIEPGENMNITISLTAPQKTGEFIGYFRMHQESSGFFGDVVWVKVVVVTDTEEQEIINNQVKNQYLPDLNLKKQDNIPLTTHNGKGNACQCQTSLSRSFFLPYFFLLILLLFQKFYRVNIQ